MSDPLGTRGKGPPRLLCGAGERNVCPSMPRACSLGVAGVGRLQIGTCSAGVVHYADADKCRQCEVKSAGCDVEGGKHGLPEAVQQNQ